MAKRRASRALAVLVLAFWVSLLDPLGGRSVAGRWAWTRFPERTVKIDRRFSSRKGGPLEKGAARWVAGGNNLGIGALPAQHTRLASGPGAAATFVDAGDLSAYTDEQLVKVAEPWKILLDFICTVENQKIALVRAPPKGGKSFLGKMADRRRNGGRNLAGLGKNFEVRYCPDVSKVEDILQEWGYKSVYEMANASAKSYADPDKPTIVYYFDEAHEIPAEIFTYFVKDMLGYAIFATAGWPTREGENRTLVTPTELQQRMFFYGAPANLTAMADWLGKRLTRMLGNGVPEQVQAATELMMNITGGRIGIIQFIGLELQKWNYKSGVKDLAEIRACLKSLLQYPATLAQARCFGKHNGNFALDDEQAKLLAMLRACGNLTYVDEKGVIRRAWQVSHASHRQGLSKALYAPQQDLNQSIVRTTDEGNMTFVHALQPEILNHLFHSDNYAHLSLEERWVTNFSKSNQEEPSLRPTHVLDLVFTWLSQVLASGVCRFPD
jgi:hypothetical protein